MNPPIPPPLTLNPINLSKPEAVTALKLYLMLPFQILMSLLSATYTKFTAFTIAAPFKTALTIASIRDI